MNPSGAGDPSPAIPQAVAQSLTRAAIFLVVTVNAGAASRASGPIVLRRPAGAVTRSRLPRYRGKPVLRDGLWIGRVGPALRSPRPAELHPFRRNQGRLAPCRRDARRSPLPHPRQAHGSLLRAGDADHGTRLGDAVSPVDEVHGFRYFDDRDLLGFVDGTENPTGQAAIDAALIGAEDAAFAGGSYVIVQKYLHDLAGLERAVHRSAGTHHRPHQAFGHRARRRRQADVRAQRADHHRRGRQGKEDPSRQHAVRPAPPRGEFGTYFIGYARSPRTIEQMLENMFVGRPPGNYDRLLDFSRAVTGNLFFVPSATFLEMSATTLRPAGGACRRVMTCVARSRRRATARSASVRSKETRLMNNLHRELAPISEAAWAQIEEEASRTLKRYLAGRRVVDVQGPAGVALAAVGTGHLRNLAAPGRRHHRAPARGRSRWSNCAFRSNSIASRSTTSSAAPTIRTGSPLKDAAQRLAFAEDRAIFEGYAAAGIEGIRQGTSNPVMTLPADDPRLSRRHRPGAEPVAPRRRQRPLFGAAGRRRLHRAQRNQRPRLSGHRAHQASCRRTKSSGRRRLPARSCSPPAAATSTCISARTSRSAI